MHEFSLVRALIAQVVRAADPLLASSVCAVHVCCGPLAGVESLLVRAAFEQLKPAAGLGNCQLQIEEQPLLARCQSCDTEFEVVDFRFHCPHCQSTSVQVIQGDQFRLISLEVLDEVS
ncbi:MAG: hydrogenase maturation nickel metallochaperone HypA [Aureliella sp.]